MRIAVVGTSHVGAPRQGWELVRSRYPGLEVAFFAAPAPFFPMLRLDPRRGLYLGKEQVQKRGRAFRIIEKINGTLGIDLAPSDVVVRAGCDWPWTTLRALATSHDIDGLAENGAPRRLSLAMFDGVCAALVEQVVPPPEWRRWDAPRLVLALRPIGGARSTRPAWATRKKRPDTTQIRGYYLDRLEARLAQEGIALFRQPEETMQPDGFTRAEFNRSAIRMVNGTEFGSKDNSHMNPKFGAIWLEHLFAQLKSDEAAAGRADRA